jgi:hypothetical protein
MIHIDDNLEEAAAMEEGQRNGSNRQYLLGNVT